MSGIIRPFEFYSVFFQFRAIDSFTFPAFLTGNIFRGALGSFLQSANRTAYRILFESAGAGTPPRPFVLRCRNLNERCYAPGEIFPLQLNLFLPGLELLEAIGAALTAMGDAGFGAARSRATLLSPPAHVRHSLRLEEPVEPTSALRVHFRTPTAFKSNGEIVAPGAFSVLFEQVYGRLNRLSSLYGSGELPVDCKTLQKQAKPVLLRSANLSRVDVSRRGTRLGQTHPIGGFVGSIDYYGDLTPFLPLLQAASFTGVGRHTAWGNGEISTERLD